jgi:hypothetical protein
MSYQFRKREDECKNCEEFYRLISQVSAGVEAIENKTKGIHYVSHTNEFEFLKIRQTLKDGIKDGKKPDEYELTRIIEQLRRYLREIEYADECLESALHHLDCFE